MAWRIEEQVLRGEIDNRTPGRVVGRIWLVGRDEAVELELEGNPWRDLAGHVLKFANPECETGRGVGVLILSETVAATTGRRHRISP